MQINLNIINKELTQNTTVGSDICHIYSVEDAQYWTEKRALHDTCPFKKE